MSAEMSDHDIIIHGPVRIAVIDDDDPWDGSPHDFSRVQGADLRRVAQRAASAREEHPGMDVLVDIDVMIDSDAAVARDRMVAAQVVPRDDTLTYVGTPAGLAGLITDLHALGICDGAVLRPLLAGVAGLIHGRVLPELDTMSPHQLLSRESRPA